MSAPIFMAVYGRFGRDSCYRMQRNANSALYANLASLSCKVLR